LRHSPQRRTIRRAEVSELQPSPGACYTDSNPPGGAGNIHHLTEAEQAEAKKHNEHVRKNSKGRGNSKDRDHIRELAEKGKEKLFGHKQPKT
jgi:hypothetical protein